MLVFSFLLLSNSSNLVQVDNVVLDDGLAGELGEDVVSGHGLGVDGPLDDDVGGLLEEEGRLVLALLADEHAGSRKQES